MNKVTIVLLIILVQMFNLDVTGKGFEIHDPLKIEIVNPEKPAVVEDFFTAKENKVDTAHIQTSAVCKMCKERLEHDMAFEKGVKYVNLDIDTKVLTIVYKKDKTTEKDLKVAITKIGYDADDMVANQKAHDRLPDCCQKGVDPH